MSVFAKLVLILGVSGCGVEMSDSGPELTGETHAVTWGPITVQPGSESTQCMVVDVGNDTQVAIHQFHNTLGPTSHHLIVYRDDSGAPLTEKPYECSPFAGALALNAAVSPIMITQKHDDLLELPTGVAYTFAPHQHLRLEMHYINTSDDPQQAQALVELAVGTADQIKNEASFLFIGSPDIDLAPGQPTTVQGFFTPPASLDGIRFFAITGHTHRFGTEMAVSTAKTRDGARTPIYDPNPFSWSEPETKRQEPPVALPSGGGFDFHCNYLNTSADHVKFGESANDEMCFFWAYYYPSRGSHVCVHSTQVGGPDGVDVCCPADAGDSLSQFVCAKLGS